MYRRLIDELTPLRSTTLGLLTSKLHPVLRKKKVVTVRWFEPEKDVPLNHYAPEGIYIPLARFLVTET